MHWTIRIEASTQWLKSLLNTKNAAFYEIQCAFEHLEGEEKLLQAEIADLSNVVDPDSLIDFYQIFHTLIPIKAEFKDRKMRQDFLLSTANKETVKLGNFKGDGDDFDRWLERFMATVHNCPSYNVSEKFHMLTNKCTGQAHQIISPYKFDSSNYKRALQHLIRRYKNPT